MWSSELPLVESRGTISSAARIFGLGTRLVLHPLFRRGNARSRVAIEALATVLGLTRGARNVGVRRTSLGGVGVEILSPPGAASGGLVIYLHGGAYVSASVRSYRRLVSHLAGATARRVIAVDYRLAPEHPFPAALDDSIAVYRALLREEAGEGIVLAGDSAGGGLALATAVALRGGGVPLPSAMVCIAPWTDLTCSGLSMRTRERRERMLSPAGLRLDARRYAGGEDLRSPLVSPLFADLTGLPSMLIQVGDDEILLDDSIRLADSARMAGVDVNLQVWPKLWHVWHLFAGLIPEADEAVRAIADFLECR